MNPGIAYATLAFLIWGLFPLYFRIGAQVPAWELVLQRSAWALLSMVILLAVLRRWQWLAAVKKNPRQLWVFAACAVLLAINSLAYIHAVQTHQVVQASLGYFINPLVSVLLGVLVLREKLSRVQWVAVLLAALGVLWLTWLVGRLPWIALTLAFSFGFYGLLRKTAVLGAMEGLALETTIIAPVVLPVLAWLTARGDGALASGDPGLVLWVIGIGPLTALPLLLFAAAARRMPLASLGLMQYLSPTMQLVLGVWVFNEPFDGQRLLGFVLIWAGLALVSAQALRHLLRPAPG